MQKVFKKCGPQEILYLKVQKFELFGQNAAMCVFTLGSKLTYKGTQNDDLPSVTSIFKKLMRMESLMDVLILMAIKYEFMGKLITYKIRVY